jgi:hypothetical protein
MSKRRRGLILGAVTILTAGLSLVAASTASANLTNSTFEGNDGNLVVTNAGNTDWANVAGRNLGIDQPTGGSDNAFGQGAKEDVSATTVVDGSIPPNKNDLTRFYEASQQVSNGNIFLYLGWERLVNIGNANLDFEINQNKTTGFTGTTTGPVALNRTAGDLLVTYDFGGSGTPTIGLLKWVTTGSTAQCFSANSLPCWGNKVTLGPSVAEAAVNTVTVAEPIAGGNLTTGLFGEAAINLTAAGVFQPGVCTAFGTTFLKSRSSSSFTAEIKDFIAPQDVNISNCGSITIHKVTQNGNSTFNYSTSNLGADFTLTNGGTKAYTNVNAGSYSVTETLTAAQIAAGWTLKTLACTSTGSGTSTSVSGSTVTITEAIGGAVDCIYTNHIKLSPTIATVLSATTASIGDTVHDSSTLTGATSDAGGTVSYTVYSNSACTTGATGAGTKTVTNHVVPDSNGVTFNSAGTFYWQAVYSGDANNNGATSACIEEQLVVGKNSPSISTTLSHTSASIGDMVHDSSALSGATSDAGGTVTYTVYSDSNCTANARDAGTKTVTGGVVPDSNGLVFNSAGTFYWQAVYSGDANNNGATSACIEEQLVIGKNSPSISTLLSATTASIGDTVHDSSTLTGATSDAGGTVTYTVYSDSNCTANARGAGTKTVTGGVVPDSNGLVFNSAGTFYWQAVYSGDANNKAATSTCTDEQLVVAKNQPGASTAQNLIPNDTFTLSGATGNAGGTITFKLYAPGDTTCSGAVQLSETVNVNGNGPYSTTNSTFIASAEGVWRWESVYSGDANNLSVTSTCGTEHFTITNS